MAIELICANSSHAKGRVERANKTLQDWLVLLMIRKSNRCFFWISNNEIRKRISPFSKGYRRITRKNASFAGATLKLEALNQSENCDNQARSVDCKAD